MPRRRQRTTNRVPQQDRKLRVRTVRRGIPDTKKLSRAFIALALARAEAEAQADAFAATAQRKASDDAAAQEAQEPSDDSRS